MENFNFADFFAQKSYNYLNTMCGYNSAHHPEFDSEKAHSILKDNCEKLFSECINSSRESILKNFKERAHAVEFSLQVQIFDAEILKCVSKIVEESK